MWGALLGGALNRAGDNAKEASDRSYKEKQLSNMAVYKTLSEAFVNGADDRTPEEQQVLGAQLAKHLKMKPDVFNSTIQGMRAIHKILPQQAAPVASQPRTSLDQLPQPIEIGTPSLMAPQPEQSVGMVGQTPNQVKQQQAVQQANEARQQQIQRIKMADYLPENIRNLGQAEALGIKGVSPIIVGGERNAAQTAITKSKLDQPSGAEAFYVTPGSEPGTSSTKRYLRNRLTGKLYDPDTMKEVRLPPESEPLNQKFMTNTNDQGTVTVMKPQQVTGPGISRAQLPNTGKTKPLPSGRGRGSADQVDDAALIETVLANPAVFQSLTPTVRTRITAPLSARGFTQFGKPLSESNIKELAQSQSAIGGLKELKDIINQNPDAVGPLSGLASLNPYADARKVKADMDRVRQRVGKALEGGVLRKEDEEKYKFILATIFDVPETAQYKIDQLIADINRDVTSYQETMARGGRAADLRATGAGGAGDTVKVKLPDGRTGTIPRANLEAAKSKGAVEVK